MIKILRANKKDSLPQEWKLVNIPHYGKQINWTEKYFRFKAVEHDKLIGTIDGKFESGVVFISALIVASAYRNKGVGKLLIQRAENFGKTLNVHRIWLITGKDWSERGFYEKLGFESIGNLPDFYFHVDFVIYTKLITD